MSSLPEPYYTPEEYLALEVQAEFRSQYDHGQIFPMAGASPQHSALSVSLSSLLYLQLRGRSCRVFNSDFRVKVPASDLYTYPDVTVACGNLQFDTLDANTLINPSVIIEVLSKSTEAYDRGDKFAQYQQLESLTDYLLVAQDKVRIEHFRKQGDRQWLLTVYEDPQEVVQLDSIHCNLAVSDVYEGIEFPGAES